MNKLFMPHHIKYIFGKEQIAKINNNQRLSSEEQLINTKEFSFETEAELKAFKKGIEEGVGWMEVEEIQ